MGKFVQNEPALAWEKHDDIATHAVQILLGRIIRNGQHWRLFASASDSSPLPPGQKTTVLASRSILQSTTQKPSFVHPLPAQDQICNNTPPHRILNLIAASPVRSIRVCILHRPATFSDMYGSYETQLDTVL